MPSPAAFASQQAAGAYASTTLQRSPAALPPPATDAAPGAASAPASALAATEPAALAPGWELTEASAGRSYFFHAETRETTW